MQEKAKAPLLILVTLILVSLSFAAISFLFYQKEHTKTLQLSEELDEIKTRLKVTETKLEESKKSITDLETKLKDTQTQVAGLTSDLEKEKGAKQEAMAQLEQLKSDLQQQKDLRSELESKLSQAQKDVRSAQNQLLDLEAKKIELENKVNDLQVKSVNLETKMQGVELGKIVVNKAEGKKTKKGKAVPPPPVAKEAPQAQTAQANGTEGKVLVVNRDYNFAVINLGSRDGVEVGNIFSFYRGKDYLGDAKVGKIHDSMAALDFLTPEMREAVKEGDRAVRKNE